MDYCLGLKVLESASKSKRVGDVVAIDNIITLPNVLIFLSPDDLFSFRGFGDQQKLKRLGPTWGNSELVLSYNFFLRIKFCIVLKKIKKLSSIHLIMTTSSFPKCSCSYCDDHLPYPYNRLHPNFDHKECTHYAHRPDKHPHKHKEHPNFGGHATHYRKKPFSETHFHKASSPKA